MTDRTSPVFQPSLPDHAILIRRAIISSLIILGAVSAFAQAQSRRSQAQDLTTQLVSLNAQFRSAGAAERPVLKQQLSAVAAKRQQMLATLLAQDPEAVLQVAIPFSIRSQFPATIQASLEREQEVEGDLEVAIEDLRTSSKIHYAVNTAAEKLSLHFGSNPPDGLLTGSRVRVKGVRVDSGLAVLSGAAPSPTSSSTITTTSTSTSFQTLAAVAPNTFGAQNTAVLLVNFQDNASQPYTATTAYNLIFGDTSNFYMENSFQQTWLTGNVFGWYTIPVSSSTCDTNAIATYGNQAAQNAGVNLSNYARVVYMFPLNSCGFWGYSTIGGSPSRSFINGQVIPPDVRVTAHEIGHGFGLYHSQSLSCGAASICTSGSVDEYGDSLDIMGNHPGYYFGGDFNAFQKSRLGWLGSGSSPAVISVQSTGTYTIGPYETQDSTPKALKILQSGANNNYYWVQLQTAQGFDSFLSGNTNVQNGVVIRQGSDSNPNSSFLLNMNPAGGSFTTPALTVGRTFSDSGAGVTITPVSVSSAGAVVSVALNGSSACTRAYPTVSMSPSQGQYVQPGTPVNYTVNITDNDSSGCGSTAFNLAAAVPTGFSAVIASSVVLNPGASASTPLQVASPASAPAGLYGLTSTASNASSASYSGTASGTYAVVGAVPSGGTSFAVTVSTNQASYKSMQTVYATAVVTSGGAAAVGVPVTFTITKSNGATVTQSATTGSNGSATFSYRVKKADPRGTYVVSASSNGVQASASFAVQ